MRFLEASLIACEKLGHGYVLLRLGGCEPLLCARPGQFVMLRGPWGHDPLLPRAFSILETGSDGTAAFLVRVVGRGTALLAETPVGTVLHVLGPLGTSFPQPDAGTRDLLVGGGSGVPPVLMQAKEAHTQGLGRNVEVFMGGRTAQDLPLAGMAETLGVTLHMTTEDGSRGMQGLVTEALMRRLGELLGETGGPRLRVMACGPDGMLRAVAAIARERHIPCVVSLEARMACGLGACLGCAVPGRSRPFVYVCKEGPVFDAEEVFP